MNDDILIRTPVGPIRDGDQFFYRRRLGLGRWVTARSVDAHGRWVNGFDSHGLARTIEIESITRVKKRKEAR